MVHSRRHFPSLFDHNSGLLLFSTALLVQEELWIFPNNIPRFQFIVFITVVYNIYRV